MSDKKDFWDSLGLAVIIVAFGVAALLWNYARKLDAEVDAMQQKIETTKPKG